MSAPPMGMPIKVRRSPRTPPVSTFPTRFRTRMVPKTKNREGKLRPTEGRVSGAALIRVLHLLPQTIEVGIRHVMEDKMHVPSRREMRSLPMLAAARCGRRDWCCWGWRRNDPDRLELRVRNCLRARKEVELARLPRHRRQKALQRADVDGGSESAALRGGQVRSARLVTHDSRSIESRAAPPTGCGYAARAGNFIQRKVLQNNGGRQVQARVRGIKSWRVHR